MERNQDLTIAYVTVKVNGGTNVLRNIFHFNSEAIEDAFRNEFNDMARLTDFVAVSAAQTGASISYAEERAVLTLGLVLDIECDESSNNFDYAKSLLSIVYPEQFVKELRQSTIVSWRSLKLYPQRILSLLTKELRVNSKRFILF